MKSLPIKITKSKTERQTTSQTKYLATSQKPDITIPTSKCKEPFITTTVLLWKSQFRNFPDIVNLFRIFKIDINVKQVICLLTSNRPTERLQIFHTNDACFVFAGEFSHEFCVDDFFFLRNIHNPFHTLNAEVG